ITIGPASPFHLADLDLDGDDDLIVDQPGGVEVALQAPDGSFGAFAPYAIGSFLTIADVDGDGDRDLVSEQPAGMFAVSLNNGAGSFLAPNLWGAIPSQP